jgi:hypothetical protein
MNIKLTCRLVPERTALQRGTGILQRYFPSLIIKTYIYATLYRDAAFLTIPRLKRLLAHRNGIGIRKARAANNTRLPRALSIPPRTALLQRIPPLPRTPLLLRIPPQPHRPQLLPLLIASRPSFTGIPRSVVSPKAAFLIPHHLLRERTAPQTGIGILETRAALPRILLRPDLRRARLLTVGIAMMSAVIDLPTRISSIARPRAILCPPPQLAQGIATRIRSGGIPRSVVYPTADLPRHLRHLPGKVVQETGTGIPKT